MTIAAAGEEGDVFGFEICERCIEHFPARHDDDIDTANIFPPPEQLPGAPFRPVAIDGRPEFPRCGDAEPRHGGTIKHDENRHVTAVNLCPAGVDPLKLGAAPNAVRHRQATSIHGG